MCCQVPTTSPLSHTLCVCRTGGWIRKLQQEEEQKAPAAATVEEEETKEEDAFLSHFQLLFYILECVGEGVFRLSVINTGNGSLYATESEGEINEDGLKYHPSMSNTTGQCLSDTESLSCSQFNRDLKSHGLMCSRHQD